MSIAPPPTVLTFPRYNVDTADGLRGFIRELKDITRRMEAPTATDYEVGKAALFLWFSLTRSEQSKPKFGHYSCVLPRLLRVPQPCPSYITFTLALRSAPTQPCTARLTLTLSNPAFAPLLDEVGFVEAENPTRTCTATLALVDITPVRTIPIPQAPAPQTQPKTLAASVGWALSEFRRAFFEA